MKALLKFGGGPGARFFISALLVSLTLVGRGQTLEVDEVRKQAEKGLPEAQNTLGLIYKTGTGLIQDYGGAQNNLAIAYALGQGVPKDLVEASKWFALAATHGDNVRANLRETIQKELTPSQAAEAEKRVKEFKPGK